MYLIDTSIWMDFLRNKPSVALDRLEEFIRLGEVGINEIIYNEICFGAKDIQQFSKYKKYFGQIPFYSSLTWHEKVANMRFFLKKKGLTTFLPDALIAHTAIENDLTLVSKDKDFEGFSKYCGLNLLILK